MIADNEPFSGINEIWLDGDHYKWRAMRSLRIPEKFITGNETSKKEKFDHWAYTVPFTVGNPLFHWTHLELDRYFGIKTFLQPSTSDAIFEETNMQLSQLKPKHLLNNMKVEMLCTTDDPLDDLSHHQKIASSEEKSPEVLPGFRPDNIFGIQGDRYLDYLSALGGLADQEVTDFDSLLVVLKSRINYFHENGCRISDHGLEYTYASEFSNADADTVLKLSLIHI